MSPSQLVQVVAPGTYRRPENPAQDPQGWYGEETLDVEAVHGMAPAAKIVFVGAANNYQDLDAAMNHVVDKHLAQIVTNSYGFPTELLPPGYVKPTEDTLIQAAIEGIGVYFSSGDNGDETSRFGFATTDWPTSSPWVTAVGGTSLSSPIFAGLMALLDQKAGSPHGFANPLFYANAGAFYDVQSVKTAVARRNFNNSVDASAGTSDFLRTFDDYSGSPTQHTNPGWDNVTGLGTPTSSFLSLP